MKKRCMVFIGVILSLCGYSQSTQQQIEKEVKDPQRKANAGKADWIIANKKDIFDTTTFEQMLLTPRLLKGVGRIIIADPGQNKASKQVPSEGIIETVLFRQSHFIVIEQSINEDPWYQLFL